MKRTGRRMAWPMALALLASAGAAQAESRPRARKCSTSARSATCSTSRRTGWGRIQAGTAEGFKYSDAMKESGVVWNDETLAAYLADPRAYIPGNRMFFPGLKQEEEIRDLLAYLHARAE